MRRWLVALLGAAALVYRAADADAQVSAAESPPAGSPDRAASSRDATRASDDATHASDDDDARYAWLLAELEANGRSERLWWTTWTATYAALAAGQGAAAGLLPDEGLRVDAAVGAVKTTLGLVALLVTPREAHGAAVRLRRMDARTAEARRLRRVRAEELLLASANEEDFGTSWVPHVAAAVTNLAGAFVLFREYDRYVPGWLSLASGTFVAELQIVTRPVAAISAWNRYAASAGTPFSRGPLSRPLALEIRCAASPAWTGLVVSGTF